MDFGNRMRFAISVGLDDNPNGAWLYGRFCYWIAGEMVGHFDAGVSLRDVLFQMKYIIGDAGTRRCDELAELQPNEIYTLISAALNESGGDIYHYIPSEFAPAKFDVCVPIDIFSNWSVFLIEGQRGEKIIYEKHEPQALNAIELQKGEFDEVAGKAHKYLSALYDAAVEAD